jgi:hypothetical protein
MALTALALLVHGYHPFAEDGGIYAAGIKLRLNPALYPKSAAFIQPYLHLSLFSNWNAWLVEALHLPLEWVLFAMQVGTTWLLLYSCLLLARRWFPQGEDENAGAAQWGAVVLVTLFLSVPVAGSSLFLMDPYVTSRSISTPFTLLAMCACLDRKPGWAVACLGVVSVFHPLMGIDAAGIVLVLWAAARERSGWKRWRVLGWVAAATLLLAAAVTASQRNVVETAEHNAAVATRYYYFLTVWHWYEWVGLAAPLLLLGLFCQRRTLSARGQRPEQDSGRVLTESAMAMGGIAIAVCLLFARPESRSHLVAMLQPIRAFLLVYYCMFLVLGGWLGQVWLRRAAWRWVALIVAVGGLMFGVQRATYPALAQVQVPWMQRADSSFKPNASSNPNSWTGAFLWIKSHTPLDALVAMDADYIQAEGEDAQGFRAIAERSSLADYSKDGGAAAVFPQLAKAWMTEHTAQTGLSRMSDAERKQRLGPLGVHWLVLQKNAVTSLRCPYDNGMLRVCELP